MTYDSTNPSIEFSENGSQPVKILYTDYDNYRSPAGLKVIGNQGNEWFEVDGTCYANKFITKSGTEVSYAGHTHGYWTWNENTIKGVKVNNAGSADNATQATNSLRLMEYYNLDRNHDSIIIKPNELPVGIINQFTNSTGANSNFTWNTIVSMSSYSGGSSSGAGYRAQFLFPNSYSADSYDKGTFYIRYGVDDTWKNWTAVVTSGNIGSYALTSLPSHTHDDRYYTESEIDTKLAGKAASSHTHNTIEINGISNDTTYGTKFGIIQNATTGPEASAWHNSIKILHNNAAGYYTQLAHNFTGTNGLWHRRNHNGTISAWSRILDDLCIGDYAIPVSGTLKANTSLTFSGTGGISYKGSKATYSMIQFIDNAADGNGNGIKIGGGGATLIGGGESADQTATLLTNGGNERMIVSNDQAIDFYTNCQNGIGSAKSFSMGIDGKFYCGNTAVSLEGHTHSYLPLSGGTLTGLLTTSKGSSHSGIKLGNTYLTAIDGNLIFQNNGAIRFGGDSWDYNVWAGLKYVHADKTIYLGLADGTQFTANQNQSNGTVVLPGISTLKVGTTKVSLEGHTHNYAASSHTHTKSQITDFSHTHDDRYYTESEIDNKLTSIKQYYEIDLSSLSTSNFYPVTFASNDLETDCEIHSPNLGGDNPYNQNYIHFLLTAQGWSDTVKRFVVLSRGVYDTTEITIGSIGYGNRSGAQCVWVRGGMKYRFICNKVPTLRTSQYEYSGEIYTVGTGYSGATNTNVTIQWTANDPSAYNISLSDHTHTSFTNSITVTGSVTASAGFFDNSDKRLKDFYDDINVDFDKLKTIPKKYFSWKSDENKEIHLGTSAQEVQEIYPEIINDNEGTLTVDYSKLSVVALAAIDKLHDENVQLKKENKKLKEESEQLKSRLDALEELLKSKGII